VADVGRNDRCTCGSGKKFKKCCGGGNTVVELPIEAREAQALHQMDRQLVEEILRLATKRFGPQWLSEVAAAYFAEYEASEHEIQLLVPWAVYQYDNHGKTVAQLYREAQGRRLTADVSAWLDGQDQAWLSVWEVQKVEPGTGMAVKDLLSHSERFIHEVKGSETLKPRDCVLGRVVDQGNISVFCGLHPRTLPPMEADHVVRAGRRICGVRTRPAALEKLRDVDVQLELIDFWHLRVEELDTPRALPQLANTDGDPILMTTDHFDFDSASRAAVIEALEKLDGAQEVVDKDEEAEVPFTKQGNAKIKEWANTLIGRVLVGKERLKIETNSMKRSDDLRRRVEAGLGALIRHRLRDHADMESMLKTAKRRPATPEMDQPPELKAIMREFKERHMAQWLDDEIPALGGLTPRAAAARPASRAKLDVLLRDMENHEARLPVEEQFDFAKVRVALGLSP
jgi:hypothetical protein